MPFSELDSTLMGFYIYEDECMIVNTREQPNGDLFVVFMIRDCPFFSGLINAELRPKIGAVPHFHWADVTFFEREAGGDLMQITGLNVRDKAEASPPAF